MSTVEIAALIAAAALGLSRLLDAAKPFWSRLPAPVAAFVPAVVAMLPQLASAMGLVHTELDLTTSLITAGALLLPGAAAKQ